MVADPPWSFQAHEQLDMRTESRSHPNELAVLAWTSHVPLGGEDAAGD
jgi:hypothetical protein